MRSFDAYKKKWQEEITVLRKELKYIWFLVLVALILYVMYKESNGYVVDVRI